MPFPILVKAGAAVTATVAMLAAPPMLTDSADATAVMPASYEVQRAEDAKHAAKSHKGALAAEKERKRAIRKAKAKAKAEAEAKAAAKAAAQAEAAAQARAERERSSAARSRSLQGGSPAANRALGMQMCAERGWSATQCNDLGTLWERESGWSASAHNPSSGAHGIPQSLPGSKMASHGSDWATNPRTQIAWGLDYIAGRYGNPSAALAHSNSVGWY